jgi:putative N-acetyltransferase (TIGR04045 family)
LTSDVRIRWTRTPDELRSALDIRERVFCEEQGVSREDEHDGLDAQCEHLLASTDEGGAVATLRLHVSGPVARIGRLAVDRDWRRRGIGSTLLERALRRAREAGCERARLAAQVDAQRLYETAGFAVVSERFEEAGITHVWMELALR